LIEAKIHPRFSSISAATAGIVFMGTPHHGSGMADLGTIVSMVVSSAVPGSRIFNRDILKDLKKNNNTLFGISSQFSNICSGMTIHSFHETMPLGPTIVSLPLSVTKNDLLMLADCRQNFSYYASRE
jgi:hypothetical protein